MVEPGNVLVGCLSPFERRGQVDLQNQTEVDKRKEQSLPGPVIPYFQVPYLSPFATCLVVEVVSVVPRAI